jgi:hypothetical protein
MYELINGRGNADMFFVQIESNDKIVPNDSNRPETRGNI